MKRIIKIITVTVLVLGIVIIPAFSVAGMKIRLYDIYLDDEYVATAYTEEDARTAVRDAGMIYYMDTEELPGTVFRIEESDGGEGEALKEDELSRYVNLAVEEYVSENKKQACGLDIGEYSALLASREDVLSVLNYVRKQYDREDEYDVNLIGTAAEGMYGAEIICRTDKSDSDITEIYFNEDIKIYETCAINEDISSAEEVISDIIEDIENPVLTLTVVEESVYVENYYARTVYVPDDTMYEGESELVQEAASGRQRVTAAATTINHVEVSREILDEQVVSEAVPAIIRYGTRELPEYIMPVTGGFKTSDFGERWGSVHNGVDIGVVTGTEVMASRSGTVTKAGWGGTYGYCVFIDHGDGVETRYAHLSRIDVTEGESVNQGDVIALSGNTGRSTGPHLHFEMRIDGTPVNPEAYVGEII